MSRFISTLLSTEKSLLKTTLEGLERASGKPAIDARITSEIISSANLKMRQLGLDPKDTTPTELYQSLVNLVELHDQFLQKQLDVNEQTTTEQLISKVKALSSQIFADKTVWVIRHNIARRLLKQTPPVELMHQLGYRSMDSMIRRETPESLFVGSRIVEDDKWQEAFLDNYKTLKPSDFEMRKLQIISPNKKKWAIIGAKYSEEHKQSVIKIDELGTVALLPLPFNKIQGLSVTILSLILQSFNEIRLSSSYFKYAQVKTNFGKLVADSVDGEPVIGASMAGSSLPWRVIHKRFGQLLDEEDLDILGPHLQFSDLSDEPIETSLYQREPALHFWYETDHIGLPCEEGTISFNLTDVAINNYNNLNLENSSTKFLKVSLWRDILYRYLAEKPLEDQVIQQLDSSAAFDNEGSGMMGVAI